MITGQTNPVDRVTELIHRIDSAMLTESPATTEEEDGLPAVDGGTAMTEDGGAAVAEDGGAAVAEGGSACYALAVATKPQEARVASPEIRLRRGRWLRLCLDERNTMVALHASDSQWLGSYSRFTKKVETKLENTCSSGDYLDRS